MNQKKCERNAMIVSAIADLAMGIAGFIVYFLTDIQALFLDAAFSLLAALTACSALLISVHSKKRTKRYPDGLYFLEPLYAVLKSLWILVLLVYSVVATAQTAYLYFSEGKGERLAFGPVIPYALLMVAICFALGFYNRHQYRKTGCSSTILLAESKGNFVDGALSLGIAVAVFPLYFISVDGPLGFLHYTSDFFITAVLSLLSLKEPIKVLFSSFGELTGASSLDKQMLRKVEESLVSSGMANHDYHVMKVGMRIKVEVILSPQEIKEIDIPEAKEKMECALHETYESLEVIFVS